jgi:pSer/pThr/pTyr-binding forkhead associated (FHA) protein
MGSAPVQATASSAAPRQKLPSLILIQADGTDGEAFTIDAESVTVGRNTGPLFASDSFLSPMHATFKWHQDTLSVTDEGSLNGVYLRIPPNVPIELADGAMFRIGQEIVRAESIQTASTMKDGEEIMGSPSRGIVARIATLVGRETIGDAYPVPTAGLHLGRERGEVLFPEDGYVSGLHCRIHQERGKLMLTDVGSSNGTYLRVPSHRAVALSSGDLLLVGQQLFRVSF